ncbi:uncharacterized protein LOC121405575 [Lytechinus variegatus]|uniref:uncharacterized protein LOC121405575 n=1 Tax=Lytechinus variegatus TaxID=7654 RepID=UPI001BB11BC9|nr:uncharacterized protein LOC121405575 [Lytechinus variegatus]
MVPRRVNNRTAMHPQMSSDDDEPSLLDKFSYSLSLDDLIANMYSVHSWSYTTTTFHPGGVRTPPQTTQQQHQQHHQQQPQHTTTNRVTAAPHKPLIQDRHVTGDASRKCNGLHALEKSPEIKKEEKSGPVSPYGTHVCFF